MNLLALLVGLVIERLATQMFHLRELRWLDSIIDAGFRFVSRIGNWPAIIPVAALVVLLALPIFVIRYSLGDALFGFPYLLLAVVVLFFSLGPNDIGEDVDVYCKALEEDDPEKVQATAKALTETDLEEDILSRSKQVEAAVCVQANNRLFAVIFWFVVLGPVGAWAFRVSDLIRRRAVFNAARTETTVDDQEAIAGDNVLIAAANLHGWLAWIPARLTAFGYALAGSFDGATAAWRAPVEVKVLPHREQSEQLLARVGNGALALQSNVGESDCDRAIRGAMAANGLVFRLLFIWAAVIAAMTLYGWSV